MPITKVIVLTHRNTDTTHAGQIRSTWITKLVAGKRM